MTTTTTLKNGVDVQKLTRLVEDVSREPWKGRIAFTVKSEWTGGFKARHTVSTYEVGDEPGTHLVGHSLVSDEPEAVLGSDAGFSPTELILSALASCLTVGYAANAAAMGIDLQEVRLEVTGRGSLEGFMNLHGARAGLEEVSVKAHVRSNAPAEKLRELHDYVNAHSPMLDSLANPVTVRSELATGR
jgi:uncharacterized OsmC-like protein